MSPPRPRHFRFSAIVRDGFHLFGSQLGTVLLFSAIAALPLVVPLVLALTGTVPWMSMADSPWLGALPSAVSSGLATAAILPLVLRRAHGERPPWRVALQLAASGVVRGAAVIASVAALVAAGAILHRGVGAIIELFLIFAVPVALTEHLGVVAGLRRAASLANRHALPVIGIGLVCGAISMAAYAALVFASVGSLDSANPSQNFGVTTFLVGSLVINIVVTALHAGLVSVGYLALRRDEAPTAPDLGAVFA